MLCRLYATYENVPVADTTTSVSSNAILSRKASAVQSPVLPKAVHQAFSSSEVSQLSVSIYPTGSHAVNRLSVLATVMRVGSARVRMVIPESSAEVYVP